MLYELIQESFHKDNVLLNKGIPSNKENRSNLAEKLVRLRKVRDLNRQNSKNNKANLIDNVTRSLTQAPSNDPVLRKMVSGKLKDMPKEEQKDLFTYKPQTTIIPKQNLIRYRNMVESDKTKLQHYSYSGRNLYKFTDKDILDPMIKNASQRNNRLRFDDDVYELFKYKPRMASTKREINPLFNYSNNVPPSPNNAYYNLNKI